MSSLLLNRLGLILFSVLGYVSFFVVVCYHTLYAVPWIFPPLAFYGFDLFLRMMRARIKDAVLIPIDNQMTLVSEFSVSNDLTLTCISDPCTTLRWWLGGWSAYTITHIFLRKDV